MVELAVTDNQLITRNNISEVINNSFEVETMLKSIGENIINRVEVLSKNETGILEENVLNENIKNSINFSIPKFTRNTKITDGKSYSNRTQKWVGHVLEIKDNEFVSKLQDLTKGGTYEIGEFEINEIPEEDRELLKIGATFYWSVGNFIEGSQLEKKSIIRFQRVYNWTEDDYNEALDRASDLSSKLKWD